MGAGLTPSAFMAFFTGLCACAACPDKPGTERSAAFTLSCSPNDLTRVVATGPCANPDAGLEWSTGAATKWIVSVPSPSPGVCHVELQFATGFTYATDVTFTSQSDACGTFIGPTSTPYQVNNPPNTCLAGDAGDGEKDGGG